MLDEYQIDYDDEEQEYIEELLDEHMQEDEKTKRNNQAQRSR